MKIGMIIVAAICIFSITAYAADDCDTRYKELINGLKSTDKIMEDQKTKYLPSIEKAYQLCKLGKMEEAYTYCREAITHNFSKEAILNDPDFAEFRAHPLFQKIREKL